MKTIVKRKKHNFKSPNSLENHSLFGLFVFARLFMVCHYCSLSFLVFARIWGSDHGNHGRKQ